MTTQPEIPEDITKAAEIAVFGFENRVQLGDFEESDGLQARTALIGIIAAALLAERNRTIEECAGIAERWEPSDDEVAEYPHGSHYIAGLCDGSDRVGAAIRS